MHFGNAEVHSEKLGRRDTVLATELDLAGYGAYVWKPLQITASEDIGLADSNVCVHVRTLYENWAEQKEESL
jgi:hypothetical protein